MKKIIWFSWKDIKNPQAGGAEAVTHELRKRLAASGHEVVLLTSAWAGAVSEEMIDGYKVIRMGNRWSVYLRTILYFKKNYQGRIDVCIDEINTIPFFACFFNQGKNFLFVHQLCREIWFYQMFFPLSLIGNALEPLYLWLLRKNNVITVSDSTKNDLIKYGFKENNIKIISEGIEWQPLEVIDESKKEKNPTLISVGSIRSMKRTDHIIKAYLMAKKNISDLELLVAGKASGAYGKKIIKLMQENNIEYLGAISAEQKKELLAKAHLFVSASVKEGWGLVVTEANSLATPAIAYDVDGLRDSIKDGETGILVANGDIAKLAEGITKYFSQEMNRREMALNALTYSKEINFEKSYHDFINILKI